MAADRHTVRLYEGLSMRHQEDANLDPKSDAILRETLERLVRAKRGTLRLDLSRWKLVVHRLGGGMVQAECRVAADGATTVKR